MVPPRHGFFLKMPLIGGTADRCFAIVLCQSALGVLYLHSFGSESISLYCILVICLLGFRCRQLFSGKTELCCFP